MGEKTKKSVGWIGVDTKMVARTRIELVTRGFSVLCSTNWATPPLWDHDLIGYDSFNIHPFCDLSSRLLKKNEIFPQSATDVRTALAGGEQNPLHACVSFQSRVILQHVCKFTKKCKLIIKFTEYKQIFCLNMFIKLL